MQTTQELAETIASLKSLGPETLDEVFAQQIKENPNRRLKTKLETTPSNYLINI